MTVEDNFGTQEIALPVEKVASTDNRTFEILNEWGIDLVAAPKQLVPFTVPEYKDDEAIQDLGTHREPNLEILTAAQPDLIVNGQRFTQHRDAIVKFNPGANIVSMFRGDDLRSNLPWVVLLGVGIVTVCDLIRRQTAVQPQRRRLRDGAGRPEVLDHPGRHTHSRAALRLRPTGRWRSTRRACRSCPRLRW